MNHWMPAIGLFGVLGLLACGASDSDGDRSSDEMIEFRGTMTDAISGAGIDEVTVCIDGQPSECTVTDEAGEYRLTASANTEVMLRVSASGYLPSLLFVPETAMSAPLRPVALLTQNLQQVQDALIGVETADENGGVVFSVSNGIPGDRINVPDIIVRLEPTEGDGPFYTGTSGLPQQALEATSAHGGGLFTNVTPGDYAITFEGLPSVCVVLFGWGTPERVRFRVRSGHVSIVRIECPSPPL